MTRHAKLRSNGATINSKSYLRGESSFLNRIFGVRSGDSSESLAVIRLAKRIASVTAAFFIVSSFSLFDYYLQMPAQGYVDYEEDGLTFEEYMEQDVSGMMASVVQEDGFVLKPNLTSTAGDRSESNQVFEYIAESGDTLSSIAERFGISKETLMMGNGMYDANQFREGMKLRILPVDGVTHIVRSGDTVGGIAQKYKVSEAEIIRQNQLDAENLVIHPDLALIIPGGKVVVSPPRPTYVAQNTNRTVASSGSSTVKSTDYVYSGPAAASGKLLWPVPGGCIITQGYRGGHYAIDCANRAGGTIVSASSGTVVKVNIGNYGGGYGNYAIVDHGNGVQTLYAHFRDVYVTQGQTVGAGDALGFMGTTGRSTGVHLHFEVRVNGAKPNPMNFF